MDNQHRKIAGYRELGQEEIDLMNQIKVKGRELLELQQVLDTLVRGQVEQAVNESNHAEYARLQEADPLRWAAIGKTDIQKGIMALVRAVAQPAGV
ncbi:hypothetical protein HNR62_000349 [Oceanisphaera litoralis]|uniref:Acb2/Tad1 domain-containing protein n=1 Tax=Oceanisphaera litoralis TaxID=225144 RepID=UPI00195F1968|nr:hypothetical protein [Oceanisphaera litoralis]MBM7454520.1 hypothetical protein [Oceanisphaera litoralis]